MLHAPLKGSVPFEGFFVFMKKVIVIGCSGSGKSYFSKRLRDVTGLPIYHLDMIWWKPDRTHITREEFDEKLGNILDTDEWIIDGEYSRTLEMRLKKCDTVFFLDFPLSVCLEGAAQRVGKKRDDIPWAEDKLDEDFRQYIIDFHGETLSQMRELLKKYSNSAKIITFFSREEADEYIERSI